jgi:hypothetical protein
LSKLALEKDKAAKKPTSSDKKEPSKKGPVPSKKPTPAMESDEAEEKPIEPNQEWLW